MELTPTTPKCHLMEQIGLSVYCKLAEEMQDFRKYKLRVYCKQDSHDEYNKVNKLLGDKERIVAALENPTISKFIHELTNY